MISTQRIYWFDYFLVPLGLLGLSLAPIFIRMSEQEIGTFATIFHRMWIATALLWAWQGIQGTIRENSRSQNQISAKPLIVLLLLINSTCGALTLVLWAWSCNQTSIANSNLLHNLTPIFVVLISYLFLHKSFRRVFVAGAVLTVFGSTLLVIQDWQLSATQASGDFAALISAITYAICLLSNERLRHDLETAQVLRWRNLLISLWVFPLALIYDPQFFPSSLAGYGAVIGLAVICAIFAQGVLTYYLKRFSSGFVSLLTLLDPPLAALIASLLFAEPLSLENYGAFVVVLIGIYVAKSSQKSSQERLATDSN